MSIHPVMQRLADKLKRTDLPAFVPGDQIRVQVKIKEGDKERLQAFEGLVIAINTRPARDVYRAQDELWPGGGAHLPLQLQSDRQDREDPQLQGAARQAVLSARAAWQGGAPEGSGPRNRQGARVRTVVSCQRSVVSEDVLRDNPGFGRGCFFETGNRQ